MISLNSLKNKSRGRRDVKRVGRGPGSGKGKTCGRGIKGQGARSGYKRRHGNEGGQVPLFKKMPHRGFTRGRFVQPWDTINLGEIDKMFEDGETVNGKTLREKGYLSGPSRRLKILGNGEITKKLTVEAEGYSASAKQALEKAGCTVKEPAQA